MTELLLHTLYEPFIFYELDKRVFLPLSRTPAGRYPVLPYYPTKDLALPVTVYRVRTLDQDVGFLFEPSMPYARLSTALLLYSGAWRETTRAVSFRPEDISLVFRSDGLYIHSVLNKCCMITVSNMDESMTTILTSV